MAEIYFKLQKKVSMYVCGERAYKTGKVEH